MRIPTNIQEVQKLNGRLASLSRFLLKLAEKAKQFYKVLKKTESFLWDENCERAFLAFKKIIAIPSVLSQPRPGAPLLLYLSIADEAISSHPSYKRKGSTSSLSISPITCSMTPRSTTK